MPVGRIDDDHGLSLDTSEGPKTFALGPEFRVRPDADFIAEAKALLGTASLS